jgi:hypothetical protein
VRPQRIALARIALARIALARIALARIALARIATVIEPTGIALTWVLPILIPPIRLRMYGSRWRQPFEQRTAGRAAGVCVRIAVRIGSASRQ